MNSQIGCFFMNHFLIPFSSPLSVYLVCAGRGGGGWTGRRRLFTSALGGLCMDRADGEVPFNMVVFTCNLKING